MCVLANRRAWAACLIVVLLYQPLPIAAVEYEVTFDATWSSLTHPGAYPGGAHFSQLIGATHNDQVTFWELGGIATPGIETMAETGSGGAFTTEITAAGGNVGTTILGNGVNAPGSTTSVFEIETDHSYVTLVTMIAPSPDWYVGVSGINLRDNGAWVPQLTVDLFGYDAGTDSGMLFTSSNADITPHVPIELLAEPFVGLPPVGTLTFTITPPSVACDLDGDADCDTLDLRVLYNDIAAETMDGPSDMNGSGLVDNGDIVPWLAVAGEFNGRTYVPGDTDLDGDVEGDDFSNLAFHYGLCIPDQQPFEGTYWDQGNFDGYSFSLGVPNFCGSVGGPDFTRLAQNFGHVSVNSVPEPTAVLPMLLALITLCHRRGRIVQRGTYER